MSERVRVERRAEGGSAASGSTCSVPARSEMLLPRAALLLSARPVCAKQLVYSEYGDPAKVFQ